MLRNIDSLDMYLQTYGNDLGEQARRCLVPLHVPGETPLALGIDTLLRKPFEPQKHVISGAVQALERQKSIVIAAEMGTGKTLMGMGAVHCHANGNAYRALVFCPGHLCVKWAREIKETIPDAEVLHLESWKDVVRLFELKGTHPPRPTWYIIARDRAKLGAKWRHAVAMRTVPDRDSKKRVPVPSCPHCGAMVTDSQGNLVPLEKFGNQKRYCSNPKCCSNKPGDGKDENGRSHGRSEGLWTYTSELRRMEPAKLIQKKLKEFFDYLVLDEVHEEKGATTAQANAAGSLVAAAKKVVALTGTLVGGYAEHLRPLLFRLAPQTLVEEGFEWNGPTPFIEKYGRIETVITTRESGGDANIQSRGSKSVSKRCRPGIMPTLFGRHLIGNCLFLGLEEIAENLPELIEEPIGVDLGRLAAPYKDVERAFGNEMRELLKAGGGNPGAMMRILGPMLNAMLLYPDYPFGWESMGYRDKLGDYVKLLEPKNFDSDEVLPKEQALIDLVKQEYYHGRQVWIFVQYTGESDVAERLQTLLEEQERLTVKVLRATIPVDRREEWIRRECPGADVVISQPKLVETGLDLFDKRGAYNFPTLVFYETGFNLFTLRQASRRAWRIGQTALCRVYYLYYTGTMQERAVSIMGKKLSAALAVDGKFSSEGLAAMSEDDGLEMALAKSLAENLDEDASRSWDKIAGMQPEILKMEGFVGNQELEGYLNQLKAMGVL